MSARRYSLIVARRPRPAAVATAPLARFVLMLTLLAALTPAVASARTHALLIGVSTYPSLGQRFQLTGPANDVKLYRQLLLDRGIAAADIQVLADGVRGGSLPTRAAILEELQLLAGKANAGDLVFVLMAGHGSQQPAAADSGEPDGLDEIFLPRDVGRWHGETGSVANAITDNELGIALQRLRIRGAAVWAVFDACHAGTLARATALLAQRDRYVPPDMLGMDAATLAAARPRVSNDAGTRSAARDHRLATADGGGDYVYLYASQSQETTPELRLPAYSPTARVHGLFSYTLYRVLSADADLSYRQAIERVLHAYASQGRQTPSPMYEGSMLDALAFGDARGARRVQWRVQRQGDLLQLQAGELHGVGRDSVLAIVPSPTAGADRVLGYVRVSHTALTSAMLVPVAYAGMPDFPSRRVPPNAYARPVDLKMDFRLRVGVAPADTHCEALQPDLRRAIAQLRHNQFSALRLLWPAPPQAADVYLCQRGGQVLLLDAVQDALRAAPGIALSSPGTRATEVLATAIQQQLALAAHAINLSHLVAAHSQPTQLDVTLELRSRRLTPHDRVELCGGDLVSVELSNPRFEPVDVTVLYIDAAYAVKTLYPSAGEASRLEPKGRQLFEIEIAGEPSGVERLLVLTAQVTPQSPIVSFASLAQAGLTTERNSNPGPLDQWQRDAFASNPLTTSRGASAGMAGPIGATTYAWMVAAQETFNAACQAAQRQP